MGLRLQTIVRIGLAAVIIPVVWLAQHDPFMILQPKVMIGLVLFGIFVPAALQLFEQGWKGSAPGGEGEWIDRSVD